MNYKTLQVTAQSLLAKFGQSMTILRNGVSVGRVSGVQVGRKREDMQGTIPNVSYTAGDEKDVLLAAGKLTPLVGDVVSFSKGEWTIKHVEEVNPGGTSLLWKVIAS
jgi:hypothetical protein